MVPTYRAHSVNPPVLYPTAIYVMSGSPPSTEAVKHLIKANETSKSTATQQGLHILTSTDEVIEVTDGTPQPEGHPSQKATKENMPSSAMNQESAALLRATPTYVQPTNVASTESVLAARAAPAPPPHHEMITQFQASFQIPEAPGANEIKAKKQSKIAPKQTQFNRTSISSLMNSEENNQAAVAPKQQEKKRKSTSKSESISKKAKADPKKEVTPTVAGSAPEKLTKENATFTSVLTPDAPKKEQKKVLKKKTPEANASITEKLAINPTVTTNKQKVASGPLNLPNPTFLDLEDPGNSKEADNKESSDRTPVIFLDVPLLDPTNPKPGQAEIVINVLKLAEDKYGWNAIHPDARSAIDMMDDILDDDDEGDDDEGDDDLQIIEDKSKKDAKESDTKTGAESEDEDLKSRRWRAEQTRINRKVGKYDYEDPFIDDAELQWEEEITTTKEGFFVFWGPLVDERSSGSAKKGPGKPKK